MNRDEITITMPKWQYDQMLEENKRLNIEINKNKFYTYIYFKTDSYSCRSIDLSPFNREINSTESIPESVEALESKIIELLLGINQRISIDNNNKEEFKTQLENNLSRKSAWSKLFS